MRVAGVAVLVVAALLAPGEAAGLTRAATGLAREDTPGEPAPAAVPARAEMPTSVLVVAPATGATTALYTSDPEYAQLSSLLEPDRDAIPTLRGATGEAVGPSITLTWLLNDVQVWRTDRIYYEAPDGPWIATEVLRDGVDTDTYTGWHRSHDANRLLQLLADLQVLGTARTTAEAAPDTSPLPHWLWGAAGVLLGLLLGVLAALGRRRMSRRERAPRQQLIDL